jgi:hypothetical protein
MKQKTPNAWRPQKRSKIARRGRDKVYMPPEHKGSDFKKLIKKLQVEEDKR